MKNYFIKNKYNSGFTLVETLVATSIFTMSLLGLMFVLTDGIADSTYAKKKANAAYLAQEGIEYVRNIRDTYVLYSSSGAQAGWDAFVTKMTSAGAACNTANGCYIDEQYLYSHWNDNAQPMTGVSVIACGGTCAPLLYDSTNGKVSYISGTDSGFKRKITYTAVNANEVKITSTVYWTQGSGSYNLSFSENLFNWVE